MIQLTKDTRFRKIKHLKDTSPEVSFQIPAKAGFDSHLVTVSEEPHPEFVQALQDLSDVVVDLAEIKKVATPDDITVKSVSFSYAEDESVGVTISAMRTLKKSKSPMLINTPKKLMNTVEGSKDSDDVLSDRAVQKINHLILETRLFLEGKRAQGDLFEGDSGRAREPGTFRPVSIPALKAALILSDAFGVIGKEGFDALDKNLPDSQKIACLGRASLELLHKLTPVEAFTLYQVAGTVAGGGMADDEDQEYLDALATRIATDAATIPPYYARIPKVDDENVALGLAMKNGHELEDGEYFKLSTIQLQEIYLQAAPPSPVVADIETRRKPADVTVPDDGQEDLIGD